MKHVKHGKKLISLLLSAAVAMSMTLSTVMTPLAASSSVSDLRQRLQELQIAGKGQPAAQGRAEQQGRR